MPLAYSLSSYDDNFCLKPPALLWLAAAYLSRAVVLIVGADIASVTRLGANVATLLRGAVSIYALVPSVIAAPVLFALVARAPGSPKPVRWVYAQGRTILAVAAVLDCAAALAASGIANLDVVELSAGFLVTAVFDIYFLVYILATRRVRDAFASFPPRPDPAPKRKRRR
ncbi:MAG TPA: DUF2919 family protein [Steroidobacteraceae bacterium]|nr:DUF2919 family protein [Steroidobacteraceae bacterium]